MGAYMGSYELRQHITVTTRRLIHTSHPFPIVCQYIRQQAVRSYLHVGQTSLNVIAE